MCIRINFKCKNMVDLSGAFNIEPQRKWYCKKRKSQFYDITAHCQDCYRYKEMYSQLTALLGGDSDGQSGSGEETD